MWSWNPLCSGVGLISPLSHLVIKDKFPSGKAVTHSNKLLLKGHRLNFFCVGCHLRIFHQCSVRISLLDIIIIVMLFNERLPFLSLLMEACSSWGSLLMGEQRSLLLDVKWHLLRSVVWVIGWISFQWIHSSTNVVLNGTFVNVSFHFVKFLDALSDGDMDLISHFCLHREMSWGRFCSHATLEIKSSSPSQSSAVGTAHLEALSSHHPEVDTAITTYCKGNSSR